MTCLGLFQEEPPSKIHLSDCECIGTQSMYSLHGYENVNQSINFSLFNTRIRSRICVWRPQNFFRGSRKIFFGGANFEIDSTGTNEGAEIKNKTARSANMF